MEMWSTPCFRVASGIEWRRPVICAIVCLTVAGCGGGEAKSSSGGGATSGSGGGATSKGGGAATSSGPSGAAQRFVSAVSAGDRDTWCRQIGSPMFGAQLRGSLSGADLQLCSRQDLFAVSGSCDLEAGMHGASIQHTSQTGDDATIRLSSGVKLDLERVGGQWLVRDIGGPVAHPGHVSSGPCAGG